MPYLSCAGCRLRIYRGGAAEPHPCPRCRKQLTVNRGGRPEQSPSIFLARRRPRPRLP
jgi:hypothetical protein